MGKRKQRAKPGQQSNLAIRTAPTNLDDSGSSGGRAHKSGQSSPAITPPVSSTGSRRASRDGTAHHPTGGTRDSLQRRGNNGGSSSKSHTQSMLYGNRYDQLSSNDEDYEGDNDIDDEHDYSSGAARDSQHHLRFETPSASTSHSAAVHPLARSHTASSSGKAQSNAAELLVNQAADKKWRNFTVRTIWTLIMIGSFFLVMAAGHFWVVLMVISIQSVVYREVIFIAHVPTKARKLPWFRTINWYFLLATNYFLYGESVIYYFKQYMLVDAFLLPLATHHRFISFTAYCIGFVMFVANLKKGHYAFQFTQFAWTHMTLLLVVVQLHFTINNIFEGMFWFFVPAALVVTNDIFAYICGFFWGRTPLIKLSPKKTVEGFVGGWLCTMIWGIIFTEVTLRIPYMLCPAGGLTSSAWTFDPSSCDLNPVFIAQPVHLGPWLSALLRWLFLDVRTLYIAPVHGHVLLLACFASLVAPFGGFFASGLKRAVKIKDFGDSIPGHGGLTDRMDCQFLMGSFAHIYYISFVKISTLTVGAVLHTIVTGLRPKDQLELFENLRAYLISQEILDAWDPAAVMAP